MGSLFLGTPISLFHTHLNRQNMYTHVETQVVEERGVTRHVETHVSTFLRRCGSSLGAN